MEFMSKIRECWGGRYIWISRGFKLTLGMELWRENHMTQELKTLNPFPLHCSKWLFGQSFPSFPIVGECYLNIDDFNSIQEGELIKNCLIDLEPARWVIRMLNLDWNGKNTDSRDVKRREWLIRLEGTTNGWLLTIESILSEDGFCIASKVFRWND